MIKTTSDRFSRLVAWRLFESLATAWTIVGNVGACLSFAWAMLLTVRSMTAAEEHLAGAYQDAFSILVVAAVAYFSALVAKTIAALARARQVQLGKQSCRAPSRVDLCLMLVVGAAGAAKAPALFDYCGNAGTGVVVTALLSIICIVVIAVIPTAFRMSAPAQQQ